MNLLQYLLVCSTCGILLANEFDAIKDKSEYNKMIEHFLTSANLERLALQKETIQTEYFNTFNTVSQSDLDQFENALFGSGKNAFNVSEPCLRDIKQILLGISRKELWAIKMLDAMGKPPSQILDGNTHWSGSYDECNAIETTLHTDLINNTGPMYSLRGKYCSAYFQMGTTRKITIDMGICFPSVCSTLDNSALVKTAFSLITPDVESVGAICRADETNYDTRAVIAILICSFIGFLMFLGTAYDVIFLRYLGVNDAEKGDEIYEKLDDENYQSQSSLNESIPLLKKTNPKVVGGKKDGMIVRIIMAFSVMSNGEKILSTAQGDGSLTAINGIRFLSITWVVLGHSFPGSQDFSINALPYTEKILQRWTFQAVANAPVSVDSFFTMSGLLLSYLFMKEMKKNNGKINWAMFYFHRFWRLTPVYMLTLMISATLSRYFGSGPIWPEQGFEKNYCKDTWWTNLLYINNLVKVDSMCFVHSWYLASDMQFFVISPLMLVPLYYSKWIGFAVCGLFLLVSFITTGVLSTQHGWPASIVSAFADPGVFLSYMGDYYYKPWCRIGPYIIGILAGYALQACNCRFKINKFVNLFCWLVAATVACLVLYGLYDSMTGTPLTTPVAAFYNTVHRTVWGACCCWVIFACATGNGGFVNTILSWKALVPLSRLCYSVYLTHMMVLLTRQKLQRYPVYFSVPDQVTVFLGEVCICFAVAFVTSLAFESPMMGLEKIVFPKRRK